ncbi:tRNA (N6-threonylcarbamoyladenosine(37)-N6)-methyltransferase TrmO [Desulfosarcina ovata]|uniref:tRNA (N6-threonylcarbamoyladenosine(37)-N6)-methyltransferase TrmO n=1 Tax=Desulfosarcina ovata subsp. ovata TaxID=2752305 RepID=A0A5K8A8U0_9BACT|nr:tRNA (N6-threonylcarbamoyladenosine(37)-N6)-methyltransferase TrmO [Desulfosarcina ovata]BBO89062.1 tRNA (N6-threonylcarbamoyladenosine(37)-N6)-methyltransferase TrmO [Desulfosarcina ovata subsp. ovata]
MSTFKETTGKNTGSPDETMFSPEIRPVGIIRNEIEKPFLVAGDEGLDMHKSLEKVREEVRKLDQRISTIIVAADWGDALKGIEAYSHLLVLYWAHKVNEQGRALKRVHPMGRKEIPEVGLFCTCSPARPNPVLACVVRLRERKGNILKVSGLDAIDGSPVIDIKPYVNSWYPREAVSMPEWMRRLMEEVNQHDRLEQNPRASFIEAMEERDLRRCLVKTAEIHGHYCPGSALGIMASMYGFSLLGDAVTCSDGLENLMAIVEINACFADGVQAVSGCTLGNNALIYRDLGKHAVTLAIRGDDMGVRVCARPDFREVIGRLVPAFYPLMEKVIKNRVHTKEDEKRFKDTAREAAFTLIKQDFENVFSAERVRVDLPGYAPIVDSIICRKCGEQLMATKAAPNGTCLTCAEKPYFQVEGGGIVPKNG